MLKLAPRLLRAQRCNKAHARRLSAQVPIRSKVRERYNARAHCCESEGATHMNIAAAAHGLSMRAHCGETDAQVNRRAASRAQPCVSCGLAAEVAAQPAAASRLPCACAAHWPRWPSSPPPVAQDCSMVPSASGNSSMPLKHEGYATTCGDKTRSRRWRAAHWSGGAHKDRKCADDQSEVHWQDTPESAVFQPEPNRATASDPSPPCSCGCERTTGV